MYKGISMIAGALVLIGATVVLGGQDWRPKQVDFADLPKQPNPVECKQVAVAFDREMKRVTDLAAQAAEKAAPSARARFVSADTGFGTESKAAGLGLGGVHMQLKKLERVRKYLARNCGGA
ncbi:hypothetical protein [Rhodobacter sp. TJ_12]|uniref:hypothetical protein n=1 Tax=Rhodobacter sp. TJ_12 TaxID=2029399 RepID=UPI001CBF569E|nr:hypothetical protein [Rhodobacter sp. TJ_12]